MRVFYKEKLDDGTRNLYLLGIRIYTYKREVKSIIDIIRDLGVKVGENCRFVVHPHSWDFPDFGSEPFLIEIGNDVCVSFGCTFVTHDAAVHVCEKFLPDKKRLFKFGKIKIGNNVFIGCKSIILPNVTIGNNSIIGAGSVVTKNIPDNEIWAGNPAKYIKSRGL